MAKDLDEMPYDQDENSSATIRKKDPKLQSEEAGKP
jgi:hypothetical protein